MTVPDSFTQTCLGYLMSQAPVLYFTLDLKGRILDMNRYAEQTLAIPADDRRFQAFLMGFDDGFDLTAPKLFQGEQLMSVQTLSRYPETYLFSFTKAGGNILVFGHMDPHEREEMKKEMIQLNQELSTSSRKLHKNNARLKSALDHIKTLQGIIPICSYCHKIRNDDQSWERLEAYLEHHTDADFSHGICPECMQIHFPEDSG